MTDANPVTIIDSEVQNLITKVVDHTRYEEWNGRERAESRRLAVVETASSLTRRLAPSKNQVDQYIQPIHENIMNVLNPIISSDGDELSDAILLAITDALDSLNPVSKPE